MTWMLLVLWLWSCDNWKSHRGAGVHRKARYSPCNAQRLPATWTAPSFWSIEPVAAALWWDLLTYDFGNRTVLSIGWFEFASMCTSRIWSGFHNCNKMTTETLRATFRVRCLLQCCGAFLEPFFKCGAVTWTILAMHCSSISQQQVSHNHSTSTSLSLHLCPLALHKPLLPMTLQVRRSRDWLCKTTVLLRDLSLLHLQSSTTSLLCSSIQVVEEFSLRNVAFPAIWAAQLTNCLISTESVFPATSCRIHHDFRGIQTSWGDLFH